MTLRFRIFLVLMFALMVAGMGVAQQPTLQISSPADSTIVNPGQIVSVVVVSPSGASFTGVVLRGEGPIGLSDVIAALPGQFSISIPSDVACRRYALMAQGLTVSGESVQSDSINLDIERPDMPVSLAPQFTTLAMEAQGQTAPMMLLATFADGSVLDITESSNVSYRSSNPSIATVDQTGTTTAVAVGSTSIVITYNNPTGGANLQRSVPVTLLPSLLTLASSSLDFGNVNLGASASLSLTVTNSSASGNDLSIRKVAVTGNYSETDNCISSSPLAVGAACGITVTFVPTAAGQSPGTLSIANSSSLVATVIPLTGNSVLIPPSITGISPIVTGPVGTSITIAGANFGATQGSSTVLIGGIIATPTSWSDTSIGLSVPNGLPAGVVGVTVTVNGITSNATNFNVAPGVNSLSPAFGPVGTPVTISGTSFGATQGNSTISFCSITPDTITSWSDTAIVVPVPNSASGSCNVVVTVNGISSGNSPIFDLSPPILTTLSPTFGPAGTVLNISGSNFGVAPGAVILNGLGVSSIQSWTPTGIQVIVPSGATSGNVVITSTHGVSSNGIPFTVTPSTSICPCTIWSPGSVPTVADGGWDNPVELGTKFRSDLDGFINGIRFYKASSNTGTHVANLWSLTGTLLATATFANETGAGWQEVSFASPVPISADTTYIASYFAPNAHYAFDTNYFLSTGVDNQMLHALANGTGVDGGDGVYAYGPTSSFPNQTYWATNYWVDVVFTPNNNATTTPSITNLSPGAGLVGTSVSITGAHFGPTQGTSTVTFNGTVATAASWSATSIVVPVPPGATTGSVVVTVNGVPSNPATFTITSSAACPCTIWSPGSVPTVADGGWDDPVELGIKFRSDVDGFINGIRFYKASSNTGTHVANLWSATGTLLATATFANETGAGWQEVSFASPVAISANTTYVASYFVPNGHYAFDTNYFALAGVDNQVLHALVNSTGGNGGNGVFAYGSTSSFPNQTYGPTNFWVDIVFQPR